MDGALVSLVLGFIVGAIASSVALGLVLRRMQAAHKSEIERYDSTLLDLRQERAEDKETNRRLRHELVTTSPHHLLEAVNNVEMERDAAVSERDQALEQLQLVQRDLVSASGKLADRETKLRQYRDALREIRESLEAQDQERDRPGQVEPEPSPSAVTIRQDDTGELARFESAEPVDLGAVD